MNRKRYRFKSCPFEQKNTQKHISLLAVRFIAQYLLFYTILENVRATKRKKVTTLAVIAQGKHGEL